MHMYARIALAVIALIEIIMPEKVARTFFALFCENPEEIELRRWVTAGIRLEGLMILGFVIWQSRQSLESLSEPTDLSVEFDADNGADVGSQDEQRGFGLRPETTRYTIASALYHADDPLAVSEIVDMAAGTEWEVGRSTTSATLYRMYRDNLVDRNERDDGRGYAYWLTDGGVEAFEEAETPAESNPFQE